VPPLRYGHFTQQGICKIPKNFFASLRFFVTSQIPDTLYAILGRAPKLTDLRTKQGQETIKIYLCTRIETDSNIHIGDTHFLATF
jgi:hypothetical protein